MKTVAKSSGLHCLITGTDTAVGKTYFSAWLLRQWRKKGWLAAGLKPISCGDREDAKLFYKAMDKEMPLDIINPVSYDDPVAPLAAARRSARAIHFQKLNRHISQQRKAWPWLLIEGVGGWRVPLAPKKCFSDWAVALNLPVVIVARSGLGTINHTLLTVESIRHSGLPILGIVMNHYLKHPDSSVKENPDVVREFTGLPVWFWEAKARKSGELPLWLRRPYHK